MSILYLFYIYFLEFMNQKEVKEIEIISNSQNNLSTSYNYNLFFKINNTFKPGDKFYFFISSKTNKIPFNIFYTFNSEENYKNITITSNEKRVNYYLFFFNIEKLNESNTQINFKIEDIISNCSIYHSIYEEIKENIQIIQNPFITSKIKVITNKPLFLLFNIYNLEHLYIKIDMKSNKYFNQFNYACSIKDIESFDILERKLTNHIPYILSVNGTNIIYNKKEIEIKNGIKSCFIQIMPNLNGEINFKIIEQNDTIITFSKGASSESYIDIPSKIYLINFIFSENDEIKNNYFINLYYNKTDKFDFYYSSIEQLECKPINCIEKEKIGKIYKYCKILKSDFLELKFNIIIFNHDKKAIRVSHVYFDYSNYNIIQPYTNNHFILNSTSDNNLYVIGNFDIKDIFYFSIYLGNYLNCDINIKQNLGLYNIDTNNFYEFKSLKNIALIQKFWIENDLFYVYKSNSNFTSGVQSLVFSYILYIKNKIYCPLFYETSKKQITYFTLNPMKMLEEKTFYNKDFLFYLSIDMTNPDFDNKDNFEILFKGNASDFNSKNINYVNSLTYYSDYEFISKFYSKLKCNEIINENEKIFNCSVTKNINYKSLRIYIPFKKNCQINIKTQLKNEYIKIIMENNTISLKNNRKYYIGKSLINSTTNFFFKIKDKKYNTNNIKYSLWKYELSERLLNLNNEVLQITINNTKHFDLCDVYYFSINKNSSIKQIVFSFEKLIEYASFGIIDIDESKIEILYNNFEKKKFHLLKNNSLLFIANVNEVSKNVNIKFNTKLEINNFTKMEFFFSYDTVNNFSVFSDNIFNKLMIDYQINQIIKSTYYSIISFPQGINTMGFIFNQNLSNVELEFEIQKEIDLKINSINDNKEYEIRISKGFLLLKNNVKINDNYYYILKYHKTMDTKNFSLYYSLNDDIEKRIINLDEKNLLTCKQEKKDENIIYKYYHISNPNNLKFGLIFNSDYYFDLKLRQSSYKEYDFEKITKIHEYNYVLNDSKIFAFGNLKYNEIFYIKISINDYKFHEIILNFSLINRNLENLFEIPFYEGMNIIKTINYNGKIEHYLESSKKYSSGEQSAIIYIKSNKKKLNISLTNLKEKQYIIHYLNKYENGTYKIIDKNFYINFNINEFIINETIIFKFQGIHSTFNSTIIYYNIGKLNESQIIYNELNTCDNFNEGNQIIYLCNFTKYYKNENEINFLLLLNKGKNIFVSNEKINIPIKPINTDKYFWNILILLGIILFIIIILFIYIRFKKEHNNMNISNVLIDSSIEEIKYKKI